MAGLGDSAMRGTSWAVIARLSRTVIAIGTLSVLSRILTPADFGVAALVLFVTSFATMFADFGTRIALVQRKEISEIDANSVYWSNLLLSALASAAIFCLSGKIASFMDAPNLETALKWVSPVFILGGLQSVPMSMLERSFGFRKIAAAEFSASLFGAITAISTALYGFGLGALVAQQVAVSLMLTLLIVIFSKWRPKFQFSFASFKSLLGYGAYVTGAGMVQFIGQQIDRPIVAKFLSTSDLGFLSMNRQMVATPLQIVVQMARKVMFPILSQIQDEDARFARGITEVQYGLVLIMAPVCLGLWAIAEPIVFLVLGPGWEMVAVIMGFTTIRAVFEVYSSVNSVLFAAKGEAKFQFKWSILTLFVNLVVLLSMVPYGLVAMMAARLAITFVMTLANTFFAVRLIKLSILDVIRATYQPIVSAILMAVVVKSIDATLIRFGLDLDILRVLIAVPVGATAYVCCELLIDRARFIESYGRIKSMRKNKAKV